MIRIPRGSLYGLTTRLQATNSARLAAAEERAATGRRINRPSDAPEDLHEVHQMDSAVADQAVYKGNAESTTSLLDGMDNALGRASDIIIRARELAVAMASETASQDGRTIAAIEVRGLKATMVDAANSSFNGRYLFAGEAWNTAPFDSLGTYSGSTVEPDTRVGDSRWVRSGMDGSAVFNGTADIFGTLEALAVALEANDPTAVGVTLSALDDSTVALNNARGEVGADTVAAEDAVVNSESLNVLFTKRLSDLVTADPVEAYSSLTELRNTYEATLQVAGSASTRTLLDYLS
jgi:flagellar hook-associated protein 3 FlgL